MIRAQAGEGWVARAGASVLQALRWLGTAMSLALLGAAPAAAHLLPAQNATMNIVGRDAYLVVSAPASAFVDIDSDHSGGLSVFEISRHSQDIATQFAARFKVSEPGNPVRLMPGWVSTPQTEGLPVDQTYVVVLVQARFARPPSRPEVTTDLFGTGPGEAQLTLSVSQSAASEVAILTPDRPSHRYFRGAFATLVDFIRIGITHILSGPDHLLFLLTMIAAAAGWRYWLGVITCFTIAHSITLTLAALDVVRLAPAIVEPGIAASIVAMATLNLIGGQTAAWAGLWRRMGLVFACGLLHGLGFAAAIGAMAVDSSHRLATLAGFNLGIELGQFVFLGSVLLVARLAGGLWHRLPALKRSAVASWAVPLPQLASIAAAALGSLMLVARILPSLPRLS